MSNWPIAGASAIGDVTWRQSVTAPATPNTDGPWVEIVSAANNPGAEGLIVHFVCDDASTLSRYGVTIGCGAAGAEQVLVPNLNGGAEAFRLAMAAMLLPIRVPAGQRIVARVRATVASLPVRVAVALVPRSPLVPVGYARCAHVGLNLTPLTGTAVLDGFGGGPIVELAAAAPFTARAVALLSWQQDTIYNPTPGRIMRGAAGSEVQVGGAFYHFRMLSDTVHPILVQPGVIPAGQRVAAQMVNSNTGANSYYSALLFG